MRKIKKYLSLIKFSHSIFALPFAFIGFFLGLDHFISLSSLTAGAFAKNTFTDIRTEEFIKHDLYSIQFWMYRLLLVTLCMIFARSAAMAFNRWLDKSFDARNPRKAIREIPAGIIQANNALIFVCINCLAFITCCWFINRLCFYLSFVALFVVLFYSYTKRFTALCHLVLGLGLSLAPIGAYLAVTGSFDLLPVIFSIAVLFWVSGFDIIYALQDEEFDRENRLHSIPAALGKQRALRISELLHLLSASCIVYAGMYGNFGLWYWAGVAVFAGMLVYQHSIVKPTDLRRVNIAFMTANGIASIIFAVFVLIDLFIKK